MKAWGIACIFIGALYGLRVNVRERRRRRALLADLRASLSRMADEIRISRAPLPDLLDRLAASCGPDAAAFFRAVADGTRQDGAPSALWREASDALPLAAPDRQTLRELSEVLRGDETQIRDACGVACRRLEESLGDADRNAASELRQSAALIFSGAALLAILLY